MSEQRLCPGCFHSWHHDTDCGEVVGYDHLNGDHECECPGMVCSPVTSVELVAAARWLLLLRDDPALSGTIYRGALGMWSEMTSAPNETTAVEWAVQVAALDTLTAHVNPF